MVCSAAISPDGQRIVTGGEDRTARVWEAASAAQVAAWQNEEKAAAERLAILRRERSAQEEQQRDARGRDQGAIRRWLVLAPIPLAAGQSGAQGLDTEQIEGEARLRPSAGEARSIGGREFRWQEAALDDYVLDFNALVRRVTSQSMAYAVCYLQSEATQRGLRMLVGRDDEAKVYLNGKEIYKYPRPRSFFPDLDPVADITLNAGPNVLVFKVVNELGDWLGSIRFTDAQGNPVKGIRVTVEPEGNASN